MKRKVTGRMLRGKCGERSAGDYSLSRGTGHCIFLSYLAKVAAAMQWGLSSSAEEDGEGVNEREVGNEVVVEPGMGIVPCNLKTQFRF